MSTFLSKQKLADFIRSRRFSDLFIELGWDTGNLPKQPLVLKFKDDQSLHINRITEKRGFVVCVYDAGKNYPATKAQRRYLVNQLARHHYEHLLIICGEGRQCWTVAIRPQNRPLRTVEVEWWENQDIQPLKEKLDGLLFDIREEETIGITDVVDRVRRAFTENAEAVTKKFYGEFKQQLTVFAEFIAGIEQQVSKESYAALMLNRLMFIYFIQKKRFLDGDPNYLENRLQATREKFGADTFHTHFYRHFLLRLFTEGLDTPHNKRDPQLQQLLGKVPYLNGGLFDLHAIERDHNNIDIPDQAFDNLFQFFGQYNWHLDARPSATGKDINPDVIGYIFEKYINDRAAMGAYYTQEDVTGYIARSTVLPFLLRRVKTQCAHAFNPDSGIWRFLRERPDDYIYAAVKTGCDIPDRELPANIRRGMDAHVPGLLERRQDWNTKTDEHFALPTEIWRETMARRQRYFDLKAKLENGEITEIDDLITYNLDIERFTLDALRDYEGSDFIAAFIEAIAGRKLPLPSNQQPRRGITILDPACGSGAFLFAALNILEPLYDQCIKRMEDFVEEDDRRRQQGGAKSGKKHPKFRELLQQIAVHSNRRYWIYKTIILDNLYGVDLMPEAAEIAKLRLFLKLAAEAQYDSTKDSLGLEPLPDIDFNIRSGNSLVGFASMKAFERAVAPDQLSLDMHEELTEEVREKAILVQKANNAFKRAQDLGEESYRQAKTELGERLAVLNEKLHRRLAVQYGTVRHGENDETERYAQWKASHRPFHWLAEFYGIIEEDGGFDVVIGNPPYVNTADIGYKYVSFSDASDFHCPDIYGYFLDRAYMLSSNIRSRIGFVIMHNLAFHKKFQATRDIIKNKTGKAWFSFYGRIPSGLFSSRKAKRSAGRSQRILSGELSKNLSVKNKDPRVRNCIFIAECATGSKNFYTTRLHRWQAESRDLLLPQIEYVSFNFSDVIPMFNDGIEEKFFQNNKAGLISRYIRKNSPHILFFKQSAYNWLSISLESPPCFNNKDELIPQNQCSKITLENDQTKKLLLLLFSGRMFFAYWLIYGDEFHLTASNLLGFRLPIEKFSTEDRQVLLKLANEMASGFENIVQFKLNAGKKVGSYNTAQLWHITDRSDAIFLKYMTDRPEQVFGSIVRHISQTIFTHKTSQS